MPNLKNRNQRYIFDSWEFLTLKRRPMLEGGWPGLFRKRRLLSFPVANMAKRFDRDLGRPTKELSTTLGVLTLTTEFRSNRGADN